MRILSRQRGLSLIELMIGILLSSLLLLGVLQIFDSNRDTMRMQVAYSRVQESGRFAADFLVMEIRMADYWGCVSGRNSIQNHLDASDTPDYKAGIHGEFGSNGVRGIENATNDVVDNKSVLAGTDILTLSGAENACGNTGRMIAGTADNRLRVSEGCAVKGGQVVLVSNCRAGELMTVTGVVSGESGAKVLEHNVDVDGDGWVRNTGSMELQQEYGTDSTILRPYSRTFFVAASDIANTPSLFVSENGGPAQELVPGVEDMQVRYGRDSTGNGVVDTWQAASVDPADMAGVSVIRVQLLVASDGNAGVPNQVINGVEYTDGRLRKLYTATAKIRNRGM